MYFRLHCFLLVLLSPLASSAQQTPTVNIAGVQTPWDVRTIIAGLIKENSEFQPVLASIHPQDWVNKGASPVYIQQLQLAQQQTRDVISVSQSFAQHTDQLSAALDEYFRLEALDVTARSLEEGLTKYGDRASADRLSALLAHNFGAREQLRDYLSNLAISQEQNFKVADQEAQRCRSMISREPASKAKN